MLMMVYWTNVVNDNHLNDDRDRYEFLQNKMYEKNQINERLNLCSLDYLFFINNYTKRININSHFYSMIVHYDDIVVVVVVVEYHLDVVE